MARLDGQIVRVTWHDAHSLDNNEWHNVADIDDSPCVCVSIGIMQKRRRHLILMQTVTGEQGADNVLLIPLGMVRKIEKLQIPHKRRKTR